MKTKILKSNFYFYPDKIEQIYKTNKKEKIIKLINEHTKRIEKYIENVMLTGDPVELLKCNNDYKYIHELLTEQTSL